MILNLVFLIVGFIILIKGADIFVDGASGIAGNFKVSKMLIGLTIVAFGTSAPELAVSIKSLISGSGDMVLGNVIGSNILNILLILGLSYWLIKRFTSENNKKKEIRTSSGWSQMDMFVTGLLFTLSAFPDPAFISLVVLCGHNGNLIVTIIAFIIWILISQFPIFLFNIAILNNCGEEFINKLEKIKQKYSRLFEQIINTAIVIIILVFIFNLISFFFTKTWMIKEDLFFK